MTIQSTIQIVLGILSCVLSLYLVFHAEWYRSLWTYGLTGILLCLYINFCIGAIPQLIYIMVVKRICQH